MSALSRLFATFRAAGSHERATHRTRRRHSRRPSCLIAGEALEPKQLMAVDVVNAFADQSLTTSAPTTIAITNQFDLTDVIGTVAKFETNAPIGTGSGLSSNDFYVELYDKSGAAGTVTSGTVANFLSYINDGSYDNSMIHRSVSDFVVQGGGFTAPSVAADQPGSDPVAIATKGTITNEPGNSNLRGTIAMAKLGGQPNSATSQWFINQSDNTFLDTDNGGYAVFGEVLGDGMTVVDVMGSALTYDATTYYSNSAFSDLPLWNVNADNIVLPQDFVKIETITALTDESELMTYSVTTSDSGKLAASINAAGDLVLTPVAGQTGSVTVTVTATSKTDGSTVSDTFAVGLGGTEPEPVFTTMEAAGSITLQKDQFGRVYAGTTPIYVGGLHVTYDLYSSTTGAEVVHAETIAGQNYLLFQQPSGTLNAWKMDSDWNRTGSAGTFLDGEATYYQTEIDYSFDFNGDGTIGSPITTMEAIGNVTLTRNGEGQIFANGQAVTLGGTFHVTYNLYEATTGAMVIHAETVNGQNRLLFQQPGGILSAWKMDSNWNRTGSAGTYFDGDASYYQAETDYSVDFNGDGTIGSPIITMETSGSVTLTRNGAGQIFANGQAVTLGGSFHVTYDLYQPTTGAVVVHAETVNGQNRLLFQKPDGTLNAWKMDANWNRIGSAGTYFDGEASYYQAETDYSFDFNGDGTTGSTITTIESIGSVTLTKNAAGQLYANSVPVTLSSFHVTQDLYQPTNGSLVVGAEVVGAENRLLFRQPDGTLNAWRMDSNWNRIGSAGTYFVGTSLHNIAEVDFGIDADGDSIIGSPIQTLDDHGGVALTKDSIGRLYANDTPVMLGTLHVTVDLYASSLGSTVVAAETIGGQNQLLFRKTDGTLNAWVMDASWVRVRSAGTYEVGSDSHHRSEELFGYDANDDGVFGNPTIENQGGVALTKDGEGRIYANSVPVMLGDLHVTFDLYASSLNSYVVAAETIGTSNRLLFRKADGTINAWEMDSDWRRIRSAGTYTVGSPEYYDAEEQFSFDADDDGAFGSPVRDPVESAGAVALTKDASGRLFVGDTKVMLGTLHITIDLYASRSTYVVAAEVVGGENRLLFKNTDGTLNAWVMDQNWNRTGSAGTYVVDSAAWRAAEIEFEFDADEDGSLGS
jgi:cyclophilin family peptidyl-prolyl cis-trans isomerase